MGQNENPDSRVLMEASISGSGEIDRGSWSDRLPASVVVVVFALLCWSVFYLPRYQNFNPDEARLVISMEQLATGWFDENPLTGTHLGSQAQYFLLPKLTTVTVKTLRLVAAVFFILTVVYVIWLSRAYRLFSKAGLLVLLLLIGGNAGLNFYGNWGVFDYSQRVLQSVLLLHLLLFLHKRQLNLSPRDFALVLCGFCLVTIGYSALLVPIAVLLAVAVLCVRTKAAFKTGVILLIPVMVVGFLTLKYATHPEFQKPRPTIQHLFFPLSDHPKTATGLLAFVSTRSLSFMFSTFAPIGIDASLIPIQPSSDWGGAVQGALVVLSLFAMLGFMSGLVRSLFKRTHDPTRFVIGAYVACVLVSLAALAVAGVNAFGDVRYALFLYLPLLVVAVYGMRDIAKWMARRLVPSSVAGAVRRRRTPVFVGLVLVIAVGSAALLRGEKRRYNARFAEMVNLIETDQSPLLFYDTFAQWNLIVLGKDKFPNKRAFLFDFTRGVKFEDFQKFVSSREDVLWITYHAARDEFLFEPYVVELENTHDRVDDLSTMTDYWRVARWKKRTGSPE